MSKLRIYFDERINLGNHFGRVRVKNYTSPANIFECRYWCGNRGGSMKKSSPYQKNV